jgi:hypothetical protein
MIHQAAVTKFHDERVILEIPVVPLAARRRLVARATVDRPLHPDGVNPG